MEFKSFFSKALIVAAVAILTTSCSFKNRKGVDLGLPSGTLWSSCNLGAEKPTDTGLFFAWGETVGYTPEDHHDFWWENYLTNLGSAIRHWRTCGTSLDPLAEYTRDKNVKLPLEYDAANKMLGDDWRLPTYEEIEELLHFCTWEWTSVNGTLGYKVSSKKNKNFIFLPAAGYMDGTMLCGPEEWGYYLTSNAYPPAPGYARILYFFSNDAYWNFSSRYNGHSIRPVRSSK